MPELVGNLLVAQSGGPTAVVNSSLAGVIQQAGKHECIEEIYGAIHGLHGVLNENLVDLNEEMARVIEGLKYTSGAALGTCRYRLDVAKQPEQTARDMDRLFEVFQAHNIRYFFCIGGNDSLHTARHIHERAQEKGYELRVMGVPKTIDNDLAHTDHCPGYGSAIKCNATTVVEMAADAGSMADEHGSCVVLEVVGGGAGWIAAGTALARRSEADAPHIVLVPEIPFVEAAFLAKVKEVVAARRCCIVVAGEGLKDASGKFIAVDGARRDALGQPLLPNLGEHLQALVKARLEIESRSVKLGYAQCAAAHLASATDVAEAAACGEGAVRAAVHGQSGFMVKLVRLADAPYKWTTDLQPLADLTQGLRAVPRDWMSEDGFMPNEKFLAYARPLIAGEIRVPFEGGLPRFVVLNKAPVEKKLPPFKGH